MTREKLVAAVTVKLEEEDLAAVDRYMSERERETRVPFSRSLAIREILRARLRPELDEAPAEEIDSRA